MVRWLKRRRDNQPSDVLWGQVSTLLATRGRWKLEPQATPGAPSVWCFGTGGETELSVSTDHDAISVYVVDKDIEFTFPDCDALSVWLDDSERLFLNRASMSSETYNQLLHEKIAEWRGDGR